MDRIFFPDSEMTSVELEKGKVSRKIRARGGKLMLVEVSFSAGGIGAEHDHPHEQATYCLSGEFVFTVVGSESRTLKPGDSVFIPASARHHVKCVAAGSLLDAFTPQREDFLKS
jgi:quercetin dioxygenase-like cupin family protein